MARLVVLLRIKDWMGMHEGKKPLRSGVDTKLATIRVAQVLGREMTTGAHRMLMVGWAKV